MPNVSAPDASVAAPHPVSINADIHNAPRQPGGDGGDDEFQDADLADENDGGAARPGVAVNSR